MSYEILGGGKYSYHSAFHSGNFANSRYIENGPESAIDSDMRKQPYGAQGIIRRGASRRDPTGWWVAGRHEIRFEIATLLRGDLDMSKCQVIP